MIRNLERFGILGEFKARFVHLFNFQLFRSRTATDPRRFLSRLTKPTELNKPTGLTKPIRLTTF